MWKSQAALVLAAFVSAASVRAIEITPLNQVGPSVQRWGWDIKAWPERLNSVGEANVLYGDSGTPANLLRVPIWATAHSPNGDIDNTRYDRELDAIASVKTVTPNTEVFASLKLSGVDTYPDWLGDGTTAWPQSNGTIFGNTVERPNPEHYSQLLADYVEYLYEQPTPVKIDYLGINNETEGALGVSRYIDTIDRLEAELVSRGVPEAYRSFQYVGPDSFGLNTAENVAADIANRGRLDTMDIIGSHFYPQHSSGNEQSWTDIAAITGGAPMWHTEVHMPIGASQYEGQFQEAYRDTLSVLFASNKRGVDTFVWWDSGHESNKVNDTLKRELVNTMTGSHPVETTPGFTAKGDAPGEPLYQAYVNGDEMTLWIANPGAGVSLETIDLNGAVAIDTPVGTYFQGNELTYTRSNGVTGPLDLSLASRNQQILVTDLPGDATMFMTFRFALGAGDYDRDGDVDLDDYGLWASTYGSTDDLRADGNFDGLVDASDFTLWRGVYASLGGSAVPEPMSLALLACAVGALYGRRGSVPY